jgi:hypothetical protein
MSNGFDREILPAVYAIASNKRVIDQLVAQIESPIGVVPFVGAGASVPFGYKTWTDFLLTSAAETGSRTRIAQLIKQGDYEQAAEKLLEDLGALAFNDRLVDSFGSWPAKKRRFTAAALVPALSSGPVITTNFDRVLEFVFENDEEPFESVVWGAKADMLVDAVHRNKRYLLKLHGDARDRTDRILTRAEYAKHYGPKAPGKIDWSLPLPRALRLLFTARPAVFIGCSLTQDRTVSILARLAEETPGLAHYAFAEMPASEELAAQRAKHFSEHAIRPIWYPAGRHDYLPSLLKHVVDRAARKARVPEVIETPAVDSSAERPPTELLPDADVLMIYSEQDERLARRLNTHLTALVKSNQIGNLARRVIGTDPDWKSENSPAVDTAHLVLLLVSADFLASDYCDHPELRRIMERHEGGDTRVVPVILSPAMWRIFAFGNLQPLPRDGKAVTLWDDVERALMSVAANVELICAEIQSNWAKVKPAASLSERYELIDVYTASGMPTVTFVEPENFLRLKLALGQQGRGVVIEGPSGIGKTTALKKAVEQARSLRKKKKIRILSARREDHVKEIERLSANHEGTVVIDDFQALDPVLQRKLSDYLKYLADYEVLEKKLVIVGIPQTGRRLTEIAYDLATRIEVFKFDRVSDETVLKMIEKGEAALNIKFERKSEIVRAAGGSLNIAQLLCFHLAEQEGAVGTQPTPKLISCDVDSAIGGVVKKLEMKFERPISTFVNMGGIGDITCLEVLKELVDAPDGVVNLDRLKNRRPDLALGIDRLISEDYIGSLHKRLPDSGKMLLFEPLGPTLVADDPQLVFYLVQTPASRWIGSETATVSRGRRQILIAYSPDDHAAAERLRLHLAQYDRVGALRFWETDGQMIPGLLEKSFEEALLTARMLIFLFGPDFCANICRLCSNLEQALRIAKKEGAEIVAVNIKPCQLPAEMAAIKALNPAARTLLEMTHVEQERLWATLAAMIEASLSERRSGERKSLSAAQSQ